MLPAALHQAPRPFLTLLIQLRFHTGDRNLGWQVQEGDAKVLLHTASGMLIACGRLTELSSDRSCCGAAAEHPALPQAHMLAKRITNRFCAISLPCNGAEDACQATQPCERQKMQADARRQCQHPLQQAGGGWNPRACLAPSTQLYPFPRQTTWTSSIPHQVVVNAVQLLLGVQLAQHVGQLLGALANTA